MSKNIHIECPNCGDDISVELTEHDNQIKEELINKIISMVKDHSNSRKVSSVETVYGQHQYYRAISVSKLEKMLTKLKGTMNSDSHDYERELFKQMCEEDEIAYDEEQKLKELRECEAEYLNGTWCI